jgi:hypothetical protein
MDVDYDYANEEQFPPAEQQGKQTPLDHSRYHLFFLPLHALEYRFSYVFDSGHLFLCIAYFCRVLLTLPVILACPVYACISIMLALHSCRVSLCLDSWGSDLSGMMITVVVILVIWDGLWDVMRWYMIWCLRTWWHATWCDMNQMVSFGREAWVECAPGVNYNKHDLTGNRWEAVLESTVFCST